MSNFCWRSCPNQLWLVQGYSSSLELEIVVNHSLSEGYLSLILLLRPYHQMKLSSLIVNLMKIIVLGKDHSLCWTDSNDFTVHLKVSQLWYLLLTLCYRTNQVSQGTRPGFKGPSKSWFLLFWQNEWMHLWYVNA